MTKADILLEKLEFVETQFNEIEKFVNSFHHEVNNYNSLKSRLNNLHELKSESKEINDSLVQDKSINAGDQRKRQIVFNERYFNLIDKIEDLLQQKEITPKVPQSSSNSQTIQLPQLNIKPFHGNYKNWLNFENSFKSIIHNNNSLNKTQRFQYLKSVVKDDALRAIEHLTLTDSNYDEAWKILEKRFNNRRLIVNDHVTAILNLNLVKYPQTELRNLLDKITNNISSLKSLNVPVSHWDAILIPIITEKLDFITYKEWQMTLDTSIPTFDQLINFLEKRCLLLESIQFNKNKTHKQDLSNSNKANRTITNTVTIKQSNSCLMCKSNLHNIMHCDEFRKLNVKEKQNIVKTKKLCNNCLRNNHPSSNCKSEKKCRICNEKHNTLLHLDREETTVNTHTRSINNNLALLSTAVILIADKNGKLHKCRALLDQGSMSNYITNSLCKKLGLRTNNVNIQIKC